jgi:xanthine dehydrogenase YagS FAD-binding subunit
MHSFTYQRANSPAEAVEATRSDQSGVPHWKAPRQYIAGGTNVTDYMKLGVMQPSVIVDINPLAAAEFGKIEVSERGLKLGALVRMSEAEDNATIRSQYPVVYETLQLAATRQLRNMASLGGNVLQRTRCMYFRDISFPCNRREPGQGCSALDGVNRQHAVLGVSENCIATYPGDFAQSLIALDATVDLLSPQGPRQIAFADLHMMPGDRPDLVTKLAPGELITAFNIPASPVTRRSRYVKIRDRASYQFAVTSAAVALDLDGDTVRDARIALGGVATVPWRAQDAEEALKGQPLNEAQAMAAADIAFQDAVPLEHNAFKIPLGKETIVRALLEAKAMRI